MNDILPTAPFIRSPSDLRLATDSFENSIAYRVSRLQLRALAERESFKKISKSLWIDSSLDIVFDWSKKTDDAKEEFVRICGSATLTKGAGLRRSDLKAIGVAFDNLLSFDGHSPRWISIPTLPFTGNRSEDRVNDLLAEAFVKWRERNSSIKFKSVLPIILTKSSNTIRKPERDGILKGIDKIVSIANPDILWTVDSSLDDDDGAGPNVKKKFPALLVFHENLRTLFPGKIGCGPYWGLSVLVWSKGYADFLGVNLGTTFKYVTEGGHVKTPAEKVAVPFLRRLIRKGSSVPQWLESSKQELGQIPSVFKELVDLSKSYQHLEKEAAKRQVVEFYRSWIDSLLSIPSKGRALALFQDLSNAYVLGKRLKDLSKDEKTARRPERIAEQLMLNCL